MKHLLLVASILSFILISSLQNAEAHSYPSYNLITVNESDGKALTNYQLYLNIQYLSNMSSNFSDVRFYDNCSEDGTPLPYCMGSDCGISNITNLNIARVVDNSYAEFFVKVPQINGSFCMRYGNTSSENESSTSVFDFFDDFNGASVNTTLWGRRCDASFSVSGSLLNLSGSGNQWCSTWYNATAGDLMETYAKTSTSTNHFIDIIGSMDIGTYSFYPSIYLQNGNSYYQGWGPTNTIFTTYSVNSWYVFAQYYNDSYVPSGGSFVQQNSTVKWLKLNVTNPGNVGISIGQNSLLAGTNFFWDWIRVRKYHYPEPTYAISGLPSAAILNITVYSPANISYTKNYPDYDIDLKVSADGTASSWWYNMNGGGNVTFAPNSTVTAVNGSNVLIVYANNTDGVVSSQTIIFTSNLRYKWSDFNSSSLITLNVSDGSTLTDYPVFINMSYLNGMQPDFSDIRFATNCSTIADELPYCFGSDCLARDDGNLTVPIIANGKYAEGFVRVPTINGSICMFYGNSTISNASSLSVFNPGFADNFNAVGVNASIWVKTRDTEYNQSGDGFVHCQKGGTNGNKYLISGFNLTFGYIMETRYFTADATYDGKPFNSGGYGGGVFQSFSPDAYFASVHTPSGTPRSILAGHVNADAYPYIYLMQYSYLTWYSVRMFSQLNTTTSGADSFLYVNGTGVWFDLNITPGGGVGLQLFTANKITTWDWIRVRKYHYPEPTYMIQSPPGETVSITLYSPQNTTYNTTNIQLNASAISNYSIDTWLYNINGTGNVAFTPNTTLILGNGTYNLQVLVNNSIGISNSANVSFTVDIQISPQPIITIYNPQNTTYNTASVPLQVSANDTIDTWIYNLNGTGNITFAPNITLILGNGTYNIIVYANNSWGNSDIKSVSFTVNIQISPPVIHIVSPTASLYDNLTLNLSVYADVATDTWWYNRNGTGDVIFTPNTTINHPSDGDYNLIVYANNSYGNIGSASVTYNIDTTAPIITITYPTNGSIIAGTVPIAVLIYGSASDMHLDTVVINDASFGYNLGTPQAWDFSNANVTDGFHSILITANDTLGNAKSAELHFNVTSTIPPAPKPKVPLVSGFLFSTILTAGGLISFLGMALTTKDIRMIVGGIIFLLIIITLSAQMIILI